MVMVSRTNLVLVKLPDMLTGIIQEHLSLLTLLTFLKILQVNGILEKLVVTTQVGDLPLQINKFGIMMENGQNSRQDL